MDFKSEQFKTNNCVKVVDSNLLLHLNRHIDDTPQLISSLNYCNFTPRETFKTHLHPVTIDSLLINRKSG